VRLLHNSALAGRTARWNSARPSSLFASQNSLKLPRAWQWQATMRNPVKGATLAGAALIVCQWPISAHLAGDFEGLTLQAQMGAEQGAQSPQSLIPRGPTFGFRISASLPERGVWRRRQQSRPCCTDGAHRRGDANPVWGYEIRT
jgi:hypothetical protein